MAGEYTPVNLSKLSADQLRNILKVNERRTTGTKWELIERILRAELHPPRTIYSLPSDILRHIGSYLRVDDIAHLCLSGKWFDVQLCQKSGFWRSLIDAQFPGTELKKNPRLQYYGLYAAYGEQHARDLYFYQTKHNPKIKELNKEIERLTILVEKLKKSRNRTGRQKTQLKKGKAK